MRRVVLQRCLRQLRHARCVSTTSGSAVAAVTHAGITHDSSRDEDTVVACATLPLSSLPQPPQPPPPPSCDGVRDTDCSNNNASSCALSLRQRCAQLQTLLYAQAHDATDAAAAAAVVTALASLLRELHTRSITWLSEEDDKDDDKNNTTGNVSTGSDDALSHGSVEQRNSYVLLTTLSHAAPNLAAAVACVRQAADRTTTTDNDDDHHDNDGDSSDDAASTMSMTSLRDMLCVCLQLAVTPATTTTAAAMSNATRRRDAHARRRLLEAAVRLRLDGAAETVHALCRTLLAQCGCTGTARATTTTTMTMTAMATTSDAASTSTRVAPATELVRALSLISLAVRHCHVVVPPLHTLLCHLQRAALRGNNTHHHHHHHHNSNNNNNDKSASSDDDDKENMLDAHARLQVLSSLVRLRAVWPSGEVCTSVSRAAVGDVALYNRVDVLFALDAVVSLPGCCDAYAAAVLSRTTAMLPYMTVQQLGHVSRCVAAMRPPHKGTAALPAAQRLLHSCPRELRRLLPAIAARAEQLLGHFDLHSATMVMRCLRQHRVRHNTVFARLLAAFPRDV